MTLFANPPLYLFFQCRLMFSSFFLDPFVKVYLLVNGKRVKKKKTASRKGSCNPVWNEALTFSLSASNLPNAAIEVRENPNLTITLYSCLSTISLIRFY